MGSLFDVEDTFTGLSDAQFLAKLSKMDKKAKEKLYLKAKDRYYDGDPIMTDHQFDTLEADLKRMGSKVINQVGGGSDAGQGKLIHKHLSPMLSLSKEQVNDEAQFAENVKVILGFFKGVWPLEASAKYDGNAIECQYANGVLVRAITRGKHGKGADVTAAMKLLVPSVITSQKTLEIRGEVVMPLKTFAAKYHKETGVGDEARYANARNMVGGVLGDESIPEEKINDMVFVAYSIKMIDVDGTAKHVEDAMNNLKKLGFNNSTYQPPLKTINKASDLWEVYNWFKKYRAEGQMQLDGIVLKMPESVRAKYGENNHHPKWALAIKFPAKTVQTRIKDIEWTVGHTGTLAPIGILEPVELDGSMVSRVSLYNKTKIEEGRTYPGALVTIRKAGDIIPQIINIDEPSPRYREFIQNQNYYPTTCPSCQSQLTIRKDNTTEHLLCENKSCTAQVSRKLANGIAALGIKGIGESTCESLYKAGIESIFDIFDEDKMNEEFLTESAEFTEGRSLEIILKAVRGLKKVDLDKVILALQLPRVGRTISKEVAKMFAGIKYSFDGLETAVVSPFMVDSSMESSLVQNFVQLLRDNGVDVILPEDVAAGAINFEMTGSPKSAGYAKKEELVEFLKTKGYHHTKISQAKLLLTDSYQSKSGKMKQAKDKYKIQILTYEDLLEKLNA